RAGDAEALDAVRTFARNEGVVFALESAHAGAQALRMAASLPEDASVVVNMSGRGDKDLFIVAKELQGEAWNEFLRTEASRL
ncbi:MAG: tryptophan synthase subunit beta, partial [Spirochaetia bacterium]